MQLRCEMQVANPADTAVRVDKFFQVTFIGSADNTGRRSVNVYSAIVSSCDVSDGKFPAVTLTTTVDGAGPIAVADVIGFFGRPKIVNQYWEKAKAVSSPEDVGLSLEQRSLKALVSLWPAANAIRPLIIEEPEFKSSEDVKRLLVIPTAAIFFDDNKAVTLTCPAGQLRSEKKRLRVSFGAWAHQRFTVGSSADDVVIDFDYAFISRQNVPLYECRIYYCFPPYSDVLEQTAHIATRSSPSLVSPNKDYRVQVHHLFSQRVTEYFDDWNRLGINTATLLRLNPSAEWAHAFMEAWSSVSAQLRVADATAQRRADRRTLLASIIFATCVAVGVDETRLVRVAKFFPVAFQLRPLFWWLAICFSVVPLILPPPQVVNRRLSRALGAGVVTCIIFWSGAVFLLSDAAQDLISASAWAPRAVLLSVALGFAMSVAQRSATLKRIGLGLRAHWTRKGKSDVAESQDAL